MGRLTIWFLLVLTLFAVSSNDVFASADDGPSESECRPYIEKAISELKTGEPADIDSAPSADTISGEETTTKDIAGAEQFDQPPDDADNIAVNEKETVEITDVDSIEETEARAVDIDGDNIPSEENAAENIDADIVTTDQDQDIDAAGVPINADEGTDADGAANITDNDFDGDGIPNDQDDDIDGDGIPNSEDDDIDGDGIPNSEDDDIDGDGIPNAQDDDIDGDGIPNSEDDDIDGDGIPNAQDDDIDGDGIPNSEDDDIDGDGIPNSEDDDIDGDGIPNAQDDDIDGDGILNTDDNDIDGDGIPNADDEDIDGDGIPNHEDSDIDGDGIPNDQDSDIDGDGIPNADDEDIDGDGIRNEDDADIDGDGVPNDQDPDIDGDGIPNDEESKSLDINGNEIPSDDANGTDGDNRPTEQDDDTNVDGILNVTDSDAQVGGSHEIGEEEEVIKRSKREVDAAPVETKRGQIGDLDGDGIPDTEDSDRDGDGIPDSIDDDIDGDGIPNDQDDDIDGDGIPNTNDDDIDGDGIPNEQEVDETQSKATTTAVEDDTKPEDELLWEGEIPQNRRSREHITELLQLNDEFNAREKATDNVAEIILRDIKRIYENAIKPLETLYKYRDLSNRHFSDPEIFSKPLILFMGPWSGGKSSILNYLADNEYTSTSLRTGAEPSPAYFNILMWGNETEVLDGTQLAADYTFAGLQKFGQGLEERLRGLKLNNKLLEKVNIVEIPGILEVRKQVSRVFPFNDACQWFIDRADIIFLVYDPAKLDVGPETEAILDQLKGREYQTRIILNKADTVKPEELLRVQSALIWNISPLMSSAQPPLVYTTSLWSHPYQDGAPARLLLAQERAFLRDLRTAIEKRIEHKIASARRFAVRVRNHAKMVDCYLNTYYNHKTLFANKKRISDDIIEHPQNYHIYEGLSTLTNISRYDLPDPEVYRDFFRLNPLYEFKKLSDTCTYFRGCPITKLDIAIAYDLPELAGKYKKMSEAALVAVEGADTGAANKTSS